MELPIKRHTCAMQMTVSKMTQMMICSSVHWLCSVSMAINGCMKITFCHEHHESWAMAIPLDAGH